MPWTALASEGLGFSTENEIEAFTTLIQAQESRLADLPPTEKESLQEAAAVLRRLRASVPTAVEKPFIPIGTLKIRPGNGQDN